MKSAPVMFSTAAIVLLAASCNQMRYGGEHPVGTGPFDSRGNYVEAWADNPAKWRGGDRKPTPTRTTTPSRPAQTASTAASRPSQGTAARPAATPQPRPQPQPQQRRYTVKRGDNLSAIARRHNTTVAGLRRANGISGSLIHPGQVLRIP